MLLLYPSLAFEYGAVSLPSDRLLHIHASFDHINHVVDTAVLYENAGDCLADNVDFQL